MALDLNAVAVKRAKTTVNFLGESADITYNPSILTQEKVLTLRGGNDEDFFKVFCEIVVDWDVKKGTRKVPLTPAGLKAVPIIFLRACVKAVTEDDLLSDASAEGKDSPGT